MAEEKSYSEQKCGHCGNVTTMEVVKEYSDIKSNSKDQGSMTVDWDSGEVYQILKCPACSNVTFQKYYYHNHFEGESEPAIILYPVRAKKIFGMPAEVSKAYEAANKVQKIDPNAYAVLLGRVLDKICEDRNAVGKSLYDRLSDLAKKGEIPKPLLDISNSLKDFRNIGAHANLGELPQNVIPVLDDLCRAILEYVYNGPQLIKEAKIKLTKLKSRQKK